MTTTRAAVLATLALGLLLGTACPAGACRCAPPGAAREPADVVFVGVVTERVDTQAGQAVINTGGPVVYTFTVEEVERGRPASETEVRSALSEASCGVAFRVGSRYRVFARHGPDGLSTGLCDGNEHLGPARSRIAVAPMWPPWGWPLW